MTTTIDMMRMVQEAEAQSMRNLLDGWQKEIDAAAEAAVEARYLGARAAKKHAQQLGDQRLRDIATEDAHEVATAAGLDAYLCGVLLQALAGYDVSVGLPAGVNVASSLIGAVNDAELSALLSDIDQAEDQHVRRAQASAAWAVQHGFVPHPTDLSKVSAHYEPDAAWANHFASLGMALSRLDPPSKSPAKLQATVGAERIGVVDRTVAAMNRYGAGRTLALLARPMSLVSLGAAPALITKAPTRPALDRVLDTLFS